ncbi:MAG: family transcriptional regulator, partial [Nocardioidaceae bacterium]|nr:family transcriptional regulator [Nocardioidaceae bacterium]
MNRDELARVLHRARARLDPADVGLPAGGRRRVAGLRREEVATLAGISVDYVVRLEQGRGPHPSASVLGSLARALQLNDNERAELFALADVRLPSAGHVDVLVRASVHRLVDRLGDLPVLVISAKGDILAWNALAAALLGDWSAVPARERNIIWQRFLGSGGRVSQSADEKEKTQQQSVASLRAAMIRYPDDPDLARLVTELRTRSERFEELWHDAPAEPWLSHTKTVEHPELGPITLDCESLTIPDSGQTVIVYSAEPGTPAFEQLALLRVVGTQRMV